MDVYRCAMGSKAAAMGHAKARAKGRPWLGYGPRLRVVLSGDWE